MSRPGATSTCASPGPSRPMRRGRAGSPSGPPPPCPGSRPSRRGPPRDPAGAGPLALAAFGVWALAFGALYGGLSVGCAFGWDPGALRALLLGLFLAALAAGALAPRRAGGRRAALGRGAQLAAAAALGASLFAFLPATVLPPCG